MTDEMVIITGHVRVPAEERDAHVDRMQDLVRRARSSDGCIHLAITADPLDPGRVNNAEVWRDHAALDAWRLHADAPGEPAFETVEMGFYTATPVDPL